MTVRLETVIKDSTTSRLLGLDRPYERFNAAEGEVSSTGRSAGVWRSSTSTRARAR